MIPPVAIVIVEYTGASRVLAPKAYCIEVIRAQL
jgi:hypothetical protein